MEKIQDAIAKARALRTGQGAPEPISARSPDSAIPGSAPEDPRHAGLAPVAAQIAAPIADEAVIAAAWAALPTLTISAAQLQRQRIMTLEAGRTATYFDVMRTRLLQQLRTNGWRRVGITSPGAGCGKSTLALNLAFSLARQPDQRTVLAEVDLRKPALARMLGLRSRQNFAAVLDGSAAFDACAVRYGQTLAIAANHAAVRNPAELLQSAVADVALTTITAQYDPTVMLFDMPPMLAGDDVMAFVSRLDCVLIVAAAEATTIKQIDICERDLASQTNVLGVVLNKCRYMSSDENYGYY